jgi:CelD/BcsL family acetyltransferase involved in cellulose biosynthesis
MRASVVGAVNGTRAPSKALRIHVASSLSELESLRPAWTQLFDSSKNVNPFARWEWTYHWWQLFARNSGPIRDELFVVSHIDQSGTVRGITPLVKTRMSLRSFGLTKVRNPGFVPGAYITEMAPYLWAPGWEMPVALSLDNVLTESATAYDWLELNGIPLDNAFGLSLIGTRSGSQGRWKPPTPFFLLKLPNTWEALKQTLSPNTREYIRQGNKRIERLVYDQGHDCQYELVAEPTQTLEVLEEFFTLHAARAAMVPDIDDPAYHPNYFGTHPTQEFLRQLAMDLAPAGNFRIARLVLDGTTVACRIVLPANNHLVLYYSGFDPRWRHYNVMAQVTTMCIQRTIGTGEFEWVNLSTNIDRSKLRWRPEPAHWLANAEFASSTLRGRAIDLLRRSAPAVSLNRVSQVI